MTPPNLQNLFGNRFRVSHDPAARTYAEKQDPWMMTLPCENGVIYPQGTNRLAVECKTSTAGKLLTLQGITVHQKGDREWTLLFDVAMFDAVAAIVKPKKRRLLSQEQKAGNAERLRGFAFKNGTQPTAQKSSKFASGWSRVTK